VWSRLKHKNIVPLLGITSSPLQIVSDWMPGGDMREYIKKHPDADRLSLVHVPPVAFDSTLISAASYVMLPKAFSSSTRAT
jgi:serine/threonine protein kinase